MKQSTTRKNLAGGCGLANNNIMERGKRKELQLVRISSTISEWIKICQSVKSIEPWNKVEKAGPETASVNPETRRRSRCALVVNGAFQAVRWIPPYSRPAKVKAKMKKMASFFSSNKSPILSFGQFLDLGNPQLFHSEQLLRRLIWCVAQRWSSDRREGNN